MDRGLDIPWMGVKMTWVGDQIPWLWGFNTQNVQWVGGQNPMDRGFYIPYVEGSNYYGYGVQYTMDRGSINDWLEVKMPCVGGSKYY